MKLWTSDSDKLLVREIYGHSREITITWKLFMACNNIPQIAALDSASVSLAVLVPFLSEFVDADRASIMPHKQFTERRFPAKRHLTHADKVRLAQSLMAIMVENYLQNDMNSTAHYLMIPREVKMRSDSYLRELLAFRYWVSAYVQPVAPFSNTYVLPRGVDKVLREWAASLREAMGSGSVGTSPYIPVPGSTQALPKWVMEQSVALLTCGRMYFMDTEKNLHGRVLAVNAEKVEFKFVDTEVIKQNYMGWRNRHRREFELFNEHNSVSRNNKRPRGGGGECMTIPSLDNTLVQQEIQSATGVEPIGDFWIGLGIIGMNKSENDKAVVFCNSTDGDHQTSSLRRAFFALCNWWVENFQVPPPYWGAISAADLKRKQGEMAFKALDGNIAHIMYPPICTQTQIGVVVDPV
jgi:hypothetical protein